MCSNRTILALIAIGLLCGRATGQPAPRMVADEQQIGATTLPVASGGPAAGKRDERLEPVALFWGGMPAGIAVSREGRIFVSFPRWVPVDFSLAEITRDGRLTPYPNVDAHREGAADRLVSVQGLYIDSNDHLWLLDASAGSVHRYDLRSDQLVKRIPIPPDVLRPGTYLNDIRVDPARGGGAGVAFIADSAGGGLIVMDVATGQCWRRLQRAAGARAEEGFVAQVEGEPLMNRPAGDGKPSPMIGQTDGIALSPDGKQLYFAAFSRREIYGIATDALVDRNLSDEQVNAQAALVARKPSANDGIACDSRGFIYTTDYEDNCIRRIDPRARLDERVSIVVQDARLLWPDAVWVHRDHVYITTNQLNRLPGLHAGRDLRVEPYVLFRFPLSPNK